MATRACSPSRLHVLLSMADASFDRSDPTGLSPPINMNINNGVRFEKHDLASALSHKIKSARGRLSHKPSSNHILPRRDGQGSNEGSKLTAQPDVGGGVGGQTAAGTFPGLRNKNAQYDGSMASSNSQPRCVTQRKLFVPLLLSTHVRLLQNLRTSELLAHESRLRLILQPLLHQSPRRRIRPSTTFPDGMADANAPSSKRGCIAGTRPDRKSVV